MDHTGNTRRQETCLVGILFLTVALIGCPGGRPGPPPIPSNPVPVLSSIVPPSVNAGGSDFSLTVNGSGFVSGSVVQFDGGNRSTVFVSSTQLQADITAADIAAPGSAQITVFNPGPGGGTSNALTLDITPANPVPVITSLSPSSVTAGGADFPLTVIGSNFVSAVVQVNGVARPTIFVSSTQLQTDITAADIAVAGTAEITVFNPGPGGGTSNTLIFTIAPATPGTLDRLSLTTDGTAGNAASGLSAISADGRFVAFASAADNLVSGDDNGVADVFLRDTCVGATSACTPTTVRVSVASDGTQGNSESSSPAISADGRFVAFDSSANSLVAGDTNGRADVFLRDTCFGAPAGCTASTVRISVSSSDVEGNGDSLRPAISATGRFIAFDSSSDNLVSGDGNGVIDIFLRDTCFAAAAGCTPSTARLSLSSTDEEGAAESVQAAINGDGRFIAFSSFANNLVAGDTNGSFDVFLRDTCFGAGTGCTPSTERLSVASDGTQGDAESSSPALSADGRFVVFHSFSNNLVPGDTNGTFDIFLGDTCFGAPAGCTASTRRVSVASDGSQAGGNSAFPAISATGRFIAFESDANDLVVGDTNGVLDIFVHDRDTDGDDIFDEPNFIETVRISTASDGTESNAASGEASVSANTPFVSFTSNADNLVAGDTNGVADVFVAVTGF